MSHAFLHHVLRADPYRDQYNLYVRANTTFDRRIQQIDLDNMPISLPQLDDQRRIADFLDDQVSRIDSIIAARRRQVQESRDALDRSWADQATGLALSSPMVPLRRVLRSIVDGPFGSSLTSAHYSDSGTRVIRLGNLGLNEFKTADEAFISHEHARSLSSHSVKEGDLLMAGLGDDRWPLGRCCVAPPRIGPAIVKADCYRIRLDDRVMHEFAAWFLSSPPARDRFQMLSRGATRARLNTTLARESLIPLVPVERQRSTISEAAQLRERQDILDYGLLRSITLLTEYKQSLITAAVTGELDVTTASRRVPA